VIPSLHEFAPVPEDVDQARFSSVSIWCDRFDVSFGAAELART
jgi:hypothetical protein